MLQAVFHLPHTQAPSTHDAAPTLPSSYLSCRAGPSRVGLQQRGHHLHLSFVCSCRMQRQVSILRQSRQRPTSLRNTHMPIDTFVYLDMPRAAQYRPYNCIDVGVGVHARTYTRIYTNTLSHTHVTRICTHAPARTHMP